MYVCLNSWIKSSLYTITRPQTVFSYNELGLFPSTVTIVVSHIFTVTAARVTHDNTCDQLASLVKR